MSYSESSVWKVAAIFTCSVLLLVGVWAYVRLSASLQLQEEPQPAPEPSTLIDAQSPLVVLPQAEPRRAARRPSGSPAVHRLSDGVICLGGAQVRVTNERGVKTFTQIAGAPPCW